MEETQEQKKVQRNFKRKCIEQERGSLLTVTFSKKPDYIYIHFTNICTYYVTSTVLSLENRAVKEKTKFLKNLEKMKTLVTALVFR